MVKKENWKGKPSQWLNVGVFLSSILGITIPLAFIRWKDLNRTVFQISADEISIQNDFITENNKSIKISEIEKIVIQEPFFLKLFSLSNLIVFSTESRGRIVFAGIRNAHLVGEELERLVNNKLELQN
jgi:hypothetical protein